MSQDLQWEIGHGVRCAFSTRANGDIREPGARAAWLATLGITRRSLVVRQVHGNEIVAGSDGAPPAAADGMVTTDPRAVLVVFGADCPGLCVAAKDAWGLAHCGWRGTAAGIASRLVEAVAARSGDPVASFAAFVGPGIAARDYEVDDPVLSARAWPPPSLHPARPAHAFLDLHLAIAADLGSAGIPTVKLAEARTSRDPRLWSYRRNGGGLVQGLVAWRV
jgi:copper oxidase (laccase) domain-containing protein